MKIFTKSQLALFFLAFACAIGVVTSIIANYLITNQIIFEAQERVKEHLSTARWIYNSKIKSIDRVIHWISIRHVLKNSIKQRNVSAIREELLTIIKEERLDFLTLVNKGGVVIHRVHNPGSLGDSLIHDIFVKNALKGISISGTQIIEKNDLYKEGNELLKKAYFKIIPTPKAKQIGEIEIEKAMVLKSAHPIKDFSGEIIGGIIGGILINRNYEIVDLIKNIVFSGARYRGKEIGTATIFLGDIRISTNVIDKEGNRAVGTRAMKDVGEQVLDKGIPWIQRAFVVDDWYITAYEPIWDIENRIVGMLYVGMLEARYISMREKIILLFFLFSMSGMLIALTVSFMLSWKMMKGRKVIL